jgi:hypothetical protein
MTGLTRTTDGKARVSLPRTFANSVILIEQISETELRIGKAQVVPEDELPLREESTTPLTDRDRELFLTLLNKPPSANAALKKAVSRHKRRRG